METYLGILLARAYDEPPFKLPFSSWINALRLAASIQHDDYILDELESKFMHEDPIILIGAAVIGNRPWAPWIEHQYRRLAERVEPISIEEGLRLGAVAIVKIARLREQQAYRKGRADAVCMRLHVDEQRRRNNGK